MKKSLVVTLALVFVLGIAGTAFAAANPFVDVPAKHWAYDAVSKLAQAGVVDGYGDGTFRGDKTITRYEMAQIVAKAMARSDKQNAETKALVDKLAVEFSAELQNLGVRVAKLEANQSPVKISGDSRIRFQQGFAAMADGKTNVKLQSSSIDKNGAALVGYKAGADTQRFQERVRLYVDSNAYGNDQVVFNGRFSLQTTSGTDNSQSAGAAEGAGTYNALLAEYAKFTFKGGFFGNDISVGRDLLTLGYGLVSAPSGFYDSAKIYFGGKEVKGWVGYGDNSYNANNASRNPALNTPVNVAPGSPVGLNTPVNMNTAYGFQTTGALDVTSANIVWDASKKTQFVGTAYLSNSKGYNYKVFSLGTKTNIMPNVNLFGEYAWNTADTATNYYHQFNDQKKAWFTQLAYKGADSKKPGTFGIYLNYRNQQANAIDYNGQSLVIFESPGNDVFQLTHGVKGFGYGFDYTVMKNARFVLTTESLKAADSTNIKRDQFTYAHFELNF